MAAGRAPQIKVEVFNQKKGRTAILDVKMELHHRALPQRLRTPKANERWNLEAAAPWAHAGMDKHRKTGFTLQRIIRGTNSW
jgi:hypothetical protein